MKRTLFIAALVLSATGYTGSRESYFQKVGTITTGTPDGGTASVVVNANGPFVKVSCVSDAYVGSGVDAGAVCLLPDAGLPCDFIRFSLGEKFYAHLPAGQDHVTAYMSDAGVQSCGVFEARN